MANHKVNLTTPGIISPRRFANNGKLPQSTLFRRIANGLNYIAGVQKKAIFRKSNNPQSPSVTTGADIWWTYFRTSENHQGLQVLVGLYPTDNSLSYGATPYMSWRIEDSSGSTVVSTQSLGYEGKRTVANQTNMVPGEMVTLDIFYDGLSSDTEYVLTLGSVNGVILGFASVAEVSAGEVDDTVTGVCNPGAFVDEGPIYDAAVQDLVDAANGHWKHSGSHLLSWCCDYGVASAPTAVTSATFTNAIDASGTSVSTSSAGWYLQLANKTTASRTTVPVKVAFSYLVSGTCNYDIRLTDGTNSVTISGITATPSGSGWNVTTGTLPASNAKYDVQVRRNSGSGTLSFYGVSAWEYES